MDTKKLRQKILELAIRGKLVPQDPNDEPASVLLGRIQKEKERLIKEGKIKRDKKEKTGDTPHYQSLPFEVPKSWEWRRLGEIAQHNTGKTLDKSRNTGVLREYITTSNLYWGYFDFTELRKMPIDDVELNRCTAIKGDLLICEGGDAGRSAIWKSRQPICFQNHIHRVRLLANTSSDFLYHFIQYLYLNGEIKQYLKGVGIQSLSGNALASIMIPLPPLSEQRRIVSVIEATFALIDELDRNKFSLTQLIKQTKSKVLNLAIRGKLAPQAPGDAPASAHTERIRAGQKSKKSTADSSHYPFEVPEGWEWASGNECFKPMKNEKLSGKTFRYIDINSIDNKKHIITEAKCLNVSDAPSRASRSVDVGDTLFSMVRPYLENIAYVDEKYAKCIASTGFFVCKPKQILHSKYLYYLMLSSYVVKGLNIFMKGDNSPSINNDNVTSFLYPIPPLTEQKRIVQKIESIFQTLDSIQNSL